MDSFFLAVRFDLTLDELQQDLVDQGVSVDPRRDMAGGEYLLCRAAGEPAWEISKEMISPSGLAELEEEDIAHIQQLEFPSLFLVSFRGVAFPAMWESLSIVPRLAGARILEGDASGTSFSLEEYPGCRS